jgi:hypothetical protein
MSTSCEFTCDCGKKKGWVTEGKVMNKACPECGRKYRGEYNSNTLTIDAVIVK